MHSAAADIPGVNAVFRSDRRTLDEALHLVQKGNSAPINDAAFLGELRQWIPFNPASALSRGDGLLDICAGSPSVPDWFGRSIFDPIVRNKAENRKAARQLRSPAGITVFVADEDTPEGWIAVGRSFERYALQATALGIRHAHVKIPIEGPLER